MIHQAGDDMKKLHDGEWTVSSVLVLQTLKVLLRNLSSPHSHTDDGVYHARSGLKTFRHRWHRDQTADPLIEGQPALPRPPSHNITNHFGQ